ncbi:hypothetical protein JYU34_022448 [Plutella xylostella]|uniref:Uncharacterized protein n=1 Tax=Plutella xylostella TaxID=51655 RepID=A0ABQ7PSH1_PLUXY|nr:hypothetical protein JYU34_022448 [Plutella xylostella]
MATGASPAEGAGVRRRRSIKRLLRSLTADKLQPNAGEARREGSAEDAADAEPETDSKDAPDKDNNWRTAPSSGRGVNRAESCRERDAPRRGKHRNASDPNRLTAHNHQ